MGHERSALVIGAGAGIGRAVAQELHRRGWRVIGTVQAGQDPPPFVHRALVVDLVDERSVTALLDAIADEPRLDAVVSSAGAALPAPAEVVGAARLRTLIELNTLAPFRIVTALLPRLRTVQGRIVFVGAGQGRVALPFGGGYAASKAALSSLADALRAEVAADGIAVTVVEPGAVRTGILESSRRSADEVLDAAPSDMRARYRDRVVRLLARSEASFARAMPPEALATRIVHLLERRRPAPRVLIGREAWALGVLAVLPARLRARAVARLA